MSKWDYVWLAPFAIYASFKALPIAATAILSFLPKKTREQILRNPRTEQIVKFIESKFYEKNYHRFKG